MMCHLLLWGQSMKHVESEHVQVFHRPNRWRQRRRLIVALMLAALLTVVGVAGPAEAAPPAIACGSTITSNVTLHRDLQCPGRDGVILGTGAVLDLGGHKL